MSPKTDLSKWLNDDQARAALGVSQRTLHRLVEGERLHPQFRERGGGKKPERVFDPEAIRAQSPTRPAAVVSDAYALTLKEQPLIPPPMAELAGLLGDEEEGIGAGLEEVGNHLLVALIDRLTQSNAPPKPEPPDTTWVRLSDVAKQVQLTKGTLVKVAKAGGMPVVEDHGIFKMRRVDIPAIDFSSQLLVKPASKRRMVKKRSRKAGK